MDSELAKLKELLDAGWEIIDIEDHAGGKKIIRLRSDVHEAKTETIVTADPDTLEAAFRHQDESL